MAGFKSKAWLVSAFILAGTVIGCSSSTDPGSEDYSFLVVDPQTGYTKIDIDDLRQQLSTRTPVADSFPQVLDCQEIEEACSELLQELQSSYPQLLPPAVSSMVDEEENQAAAMLVVLDVYGLPEALPENSRGVYKNNEVDAAWNSALGGDGRINDSDEAWRAVFHVFEFAVAEYRQIGDSSLTNDARLVTNVFTAANENSLMALLLVWPPDLPLPEPAYLIDEDLEELRKKAQAGSFNYCRWCTPP
jgi:hypothetical protein